MRASFFQKNEACGNSGAHYDKAPEFLCNLEQHAQKNAAPGCALFTKNLTTLDKSKCYHYNNNCRQQTLHGENLYEVATDTKFDEVLRAYYTLKVVYI